MNSSTDHSARLGLSKSDRIWPGETSTRGYCVTAFVITESGMFG